MKIFLKISVIVLFFIVLIQIFHSCKQEELATLSTSIVTNITATSAFSGGVITSDGGAKVTGRGVCWGANANPATTESKTNDGTDIGQFVSNISGLTAGSKYHVRAYATNSVGTAYGADISFSTLGQVPEVVTQTATDITYSGATINGTVNANHLSATVTFEYGTSATYGMSIAAIPSSVTGNNPTSVSAIVSGLTPGTTYHYRVNAFNSLGTQNGNDLSFTTLKATPTIITSTITNITTSGAECGGNITNEGIGAILARGVCWSTNSNPTTNDKKTIDGAGTGSFTSRMTGLNDATLYYVRAYATNISGTSYGNEVSFTTVANPVCGQTIVEDITVTEDVLCSSGAPYAIVIGASNVVFDLGGHTISGSTPTIGLFAKDVENLTIRNGIIKGFEKGIFLIGVRNVIMENLTVVNKDISDPNHFIFGIAVDNCQDVVVRDSRFEFLTVAHKEAVEVYKSKILVDNINVQGGGAGVSFSFTPVCDPQKCPNIGEVVNSHFSNIYVAGIWIACTSSLRISGNEIFNGPEGAGIGIQGDAPFPGAVTGLIVENNTIHNNQIGVELRGIIGSQISNNVVKNNIGCGIMVRQSLGCLINEPGWECFCSTGNKISDNEVLGNGLDLYHYEDCLGNIWERNIYETKQGIEIH